MTLCRHKPIFDNGVSCKFHPQYGNGIGGAAKYGSQYLYFYLNLKLLDGSESCWFKDQKNSSPPP